MFDFRTRFRGAWITWPATAGGSFALMGALAVVAFPAAAKPPEDEATDVSDAGVNRTSTSSMGVSLELRRPRASADQRTLRSHAFNDPLFADSAFVSGYAAFRPGGAVALVDEYRDPDGPTYDLGLAGGSLGFGFGARFGERVGWRGRLDGLLVVGTNEESRQNAGGVACADLDTGLVFRLLRNEEHAVQLSAHAKVVGHLGFSVDPSPIAAAKAAAESGAQVDAGTEGVLARRRMVLGGGGISVAHALNRNFSVQASADLLGGQRNTSWIDADGVLEEPQLRAGIGGSVDVDTWPAVPLAMKMEYRYEQSVTWVADASTTESYGSHRVGGGLYFSAHPDASVGLTASGRIGGEPDPFTHVALVGMVVQGYL